MILFAVMGLCQFALQFVVNYRFVFPLDAGILKPATMAAYNNLIPIHSGSGIYKSNGIFMLEPSNFSQFLALGIIVEMIRFKKAAVMALYGIALLTTFSGTGWIMLVCVVPVYLLRQRNYSMLIGLALGFAMLIAIAPFIGLEALINRIHEFSSTATSGYARFLSMFPTIRDFLLPDVEILCFGLGAGMLKSLQGHVSYAAHDPSWGKILLEYGIIGSIAYFLLMMHVFIKSPQSAALRAALAIQFLFLFEYVLTPALHTVILALLAWQPRVEDERPLT